MGFAGLRGFLRESIRCIIPAFSQCPGTHWRRSLTFAAWTSEATCSEYSDIRNQLYLQTLYRCFPSAPPEAHYSKTGHLCTRLAQSMYHGNDTSPNCLKGKPDAQLISALALALCYHALSCITLNVSSYIYTMLVARPTTRAAHEKALRKFTKESGLPADAATHGPQLAIHLREEVRLPR